MGASGAIFRKVESAEVMEGAAAAAAPARWRSLPAKVWVWGLGYTGRNIAPTYKWHKC